MRATLPDINAFGPWAIHLKKQQSSFSKCLFFSVFKTPCEHPLFTSVNTFAKNGYSSINNLHLIAFRIWIFGWQNRFVPCCFDGQPFRLILLHWSMKSTSSAFSYNMKDLLHHFLATDGWKRFEGQPYSKFALLLKTSPWCLETLLLQLSLHYPDQNYFLIDAIH